MKGLHAGRRFLKARWVLPMSSPPVENGVVEIDGATIVAVHPAQESASVAADHRQLTDYGDAVIMPGLINLHTHLEYTALRGFDTDSDLFHWIPGLMGQTRNWQPEDFLNSARQGVRELMASGTTCAVDSSYSGQAALAMAERGLRGVVALELFGVDDDKADEAWQRWLTRYEELLTRLETFVGEKQLPAASCEHLRISVAPHAPYTVCPALMKKALDWSRQSRLPATMHLAESPREVEWMSSGEEVVDGFLLRIPGIVPNGDVTQLRWRSCKQSPVSALYEKGLLGEHLVAAHSVQLQPGDIGKLSSAAVKVAHCPRSNARLRNGIAPMGELLKSGVAVGFGTDSAASNSDLDLLSEARFSWSLQRARYPEFALPSEKAISMLTLEAAAAIGMADSIGSLQPGKLADLAIFELNNAGRLTSRNPYDALLYGQTSLKSVFVNGSEHFPGVL